MKAPPHIATAGAILVALAACTSQSTQHRAQSAASVPLSNADVVNFQAAISRAERMPGFAGHYVEGDILYLGFTVDKIDHARPLESQKIRSFVAKYDMIQLGAAFQWAVKLLTPESYGPLAISIDKKRNGISVSSAILTTAGGSGGCSRLILIPKSDPANGVPIFDDRNC
jgi:hypothetical protein